MTSRPRHRRVRGGALTAAICALTFVVVLTHSLLRYLSFHAPAYDLGFFDQLTANLSAGRGWTSSFIGYDFRGQHWEPILLVWAQLYHVVASPMTLLVVSAVAVALAPWAAWRLARRWLGDEHPGAVVAALATALSPLVLRAAGFDYHSEVFTPVLALLALEAASRRRWLLVAVCCGLLALLKEDAFLVVAGIGWIIAVTGQRRAGLVVLGAGLLAFVLVVGVYEPAVRDGATSDLLGRYVYLGGGGPATTPGGVVAGMLSHPGTWISHLLSSGPLQGLAVAFLPLALLPLFSGWALLAPLPPLLLALLSNSPYQSTLTLQYGIEAFPLLLACALLGWRGLERRRAGRHARPARPGPRALVGAALVVIVASVVVGVDVRARVDDLSGLSRSAAAGSVLATVPASASVSASTGLVAHLSERPDIAEFPNPGAPDFVVIDTLLPPSDNAAGAGYSGALTKLQASYHLVSSGGGVTLWERR